MPDRMQAEYLDVDRYRELYHTYEMDAVYVQYYGEISKKIKVCCMHHVIKLFGFEILPVAVLFLH
jgi:hypothetical protein